MEVNRLSADELAYELRVRGVTVVGTTVETKRVALIELLRKERQGVVVPEFTQASDPATELVICASKLEAISGDLESFDSANRENLFRRLRTKLTHLDRRLLRIQPVNQEQQNEKDRLLHLLGDANGLLQDLNKVMPPQGSLLDLASPDPLELPQGHRSSSPAEEVDFDWRQGVAERLAEISKDTYFVHIKASHTIDPLVLAFYKVDPLVQTLPLRKVDPLLLKIHEADPLAWYKVSVAGLRLLPSVRNVTSAVVASPLTTSIYSSSLCRKKAFVVTLKISTLDINHQNGREALLWFRSVRTQFDNWDDVASGLRRNFLPYDYENSLWEEIRRRSQGAEEKLMLYVAAMENLFYRLAEVPTEPVRVSLIRRNLLPYLQTALALSEMPTVGRLLELGRSVEEVHLRAASYCPPPSKQLLEPEMAYAGNKSTSRSSVAALSHTSHTPDQQSHNSPDASLRCWKCRLVGHQAKNCQNRPGLVCYKCQKPNVTSHGRTVACLKNPRPHLDYVLANVKGDERPYLKVKILGREVKGLLDSGATRSVMGRERYEILKELNLSVDHNDRMQCSTANGQIIESLGTVGTHPGRRPNKTY
ncbi:hypothetical protein Zmor_027886 [Zophobas morio]|uniref:CCHC-type domain-containing protein n=1 Tax=Zophobas morio TaxID=2755281 RepID=A0AA38M2V8_9CUCU|nr:hypothetical protein Zmor_027886 [Zophobas morio]